MNLDRPAGLTRARQASLRATVNLVQHNWASLLSGLSSGFCGIGIGFDRFGPWVEKVRMKRSGKYSGAGLAGAFFGPGCIGHFGSDRLS